MLINPVSDMLTRIRNSNLKLNKEVSFPFSKFKFSIAEKMKKEGYLSEVWTNKDKKEIKVKIRFFNRKSSIENLVRVSNSSQRIYLKKEKIKIFCIGKKSYFFSTPKGILTHKEAVSENVGGELIFFVS